MYVSTESWISFVCGGCKYKTQNLSLLFDPAFEEDRGFEMMTLKQTEAPV